MVAEQAYFAATERDGGEVLDVKEVGAAQMRVAIRLPRPQPTSVDLDFNRGALRTCGIEVEPPVHVFKLAADVGDHHMARAEFRGRVSGFQEPTRQGVHPPAGHSKQIARSNKRLVKHSRLLTSNLWKGCRTLLALSCERVGFMHAGLGFSRLYPSRTIQIT